MRIEVEIMLNQYQQPIGDNLVNYHAGEFPEIDQLIGTYARIEKLSLAKHGEDLYAVLGPEANDKDFTYLPINPFQTFSDYTAYIKTLETSNDPYYLAIMDKETGKALGLFALLNIDTANRALEMGWVIYSDKLKQHRIATEAQFLLMQYSFEHLAYRRYQWKCDRFNQPSYHAAIRLGFTYEGCLRNAVVYKNRSRDSQFFSIIDQEWPAIKAMFQKWLHPGNFDAQAQQLASLNSFKTIKDA